MHVHIMPASFVLQPESPLSPVTTSASGPPQLQEAREHQITAHDLNFVMDICARVEAEAKVHRRMALRNLKKRRNHTGNSSRPFDIEADLENSLHLVECLPQGSRGADPPREEFLQLARAVSGAEASPKQILENGKCGVVTNHVKGATQHSEVPLSDLASLSAFLFEEHAIQLLSENDSQFESQHSRGTASPWLILSDVEKRVPAHSQVALSWPDKWLTRRIGRLLGVGDPQRQTGEQWRGVRRELEENGQRRRTRKRKRKEMERAGSDRVTGGKQDDACETYSSDNYSDTSDEHEEKSPIDNAFGQN